MQPQRSIVRFLLRARPTGWLRLLPLAVALLAVALYYLLGLHHKVDFDELVDQRWVLKDFVGRHPVAGAALFGLLYIVVTMLSLPVATLLSIFGGLVFGLAQAMLLVPLAATAGACCAYLIARGLVDSVKGVLPVRLRQSLRHGFSQHAFTYLLALRLAPFFPFAVVNIAAAFFRVPLRTFIAATLLGILPATFIYVWLGSGLENAITAAEQRGDEYTLADCLTPDVTIALASLAGFSILSLLLRPLVARRMLAAGAQDEAPCAKSDGAQGLMADTILKPDLCVIGAGAAGLSAAAGAAAFGVNVVLVERGVMGGDCLNHGCVPSKALLAAAAHAEGMRQGWPGVSSGHVSVDFAEVMEGVQARIESLAPQDSVERFESLGVRVIQAEARFTGRGTLEAGSFTIAARRFVIATGSRPRIPDIAGLSDIPVLTNETVFSLRRLPSHLVILGGGASGMEFAQAFRQLGSRVTVIQSTRVLSRSDAEGAALVRARLQAQGVVFHENTRVVSAANDADGIQLEVASGGATIVVSGSHLLVSAGRVATTDGLALDLAGVEQGGKGITTDRGLRTTNPAIYAIGDIRGAEQFTHAAGAEAGLALRSILFRLPVNRDRLLVPRVLYTDPELAEVGLGEAQARQAGKPVQVIRVPFSANDGAVIHDAASGFLKVIVGRRGRILGVCIAGRGAGEMLGFWTLAIARGLSLRHLQGLIFAYPTMGEIARRAALEHARPLAQSRWTRALVRFLSRFR